MLCNAQLSTILQLEKHISNQHYPLEKTCQICSKTFSNRGQIAARHIRTVHQKLKPYKCGKCDKSFGERRNLNVHVEAVHVNLKVHKCQICDKSFSTNHHLITHKSNVHTRKLNNPSEELVNCQICNKSFSRHRDLSRHVCR